MKKHMIARKYIMTCLCCIPLLMGINSCNTQGADTITLSMAKYNQLKNENIRLTNLVKQYEVVVNSLLSEDKNNIDNSEVTTKENRTLLGEFTLTYYCVEPNCGICGGGGHTASGTIVEPYKTVAVDTNVIPFGTKLYIDGVGYRIAEDRGGAIKGNKIDIAVTTHEEALQLGRKNNVKVWIVE